MPNRTEARPAKAVLTYATGRLPLLRLFSTPLKTQSKANRRQSATKYRAFRAPQVVAHRCYCGAASVPFRNLSCWTMV